MGNGWIHWHIIPPNKWEQPAKNPKRAITKEEHQRIIAVELNVERRHYYEMLWLIGAAQTDCSLLTVANFDRNKLILSYQRKKTGEWSRLRIGKSLEELLERLPNEGYLFPKMASLKDKDRSAEFCRRCRGLEIKGI